MTKGKPWTRLEERNLREMIEKGANIEGLAEAFNREPDAIRMKLNRMGLKVVVQKSQKHRTTTSTVLPKSIITHEKALRILAGALHDLKKPGLDKLELQRLRILVDAVEAYDSVLEKFEGWVEIENRLVEMDKKIGELQKIQKVQA
jgi:aspartate aminotransferase-like enzyme